MVFFLDTLLGSFILSSTSLRLVGAGTACAGGGGGEDMLDMLDGKKSGSLGNVSVS